MKPLPPEARIAVLRLSALGDVLLAVPAVRELRRLAPRARIEWITAPRLVPLLEGLPFVDAVLPWPQPARGYDVVIDLQRKVRTVAFALRTGARRAAARRRTRTGLLRAALGFDRPVSGEHQTARYFGALRELGLATGAPGPLEIRLSPPERARAEAQVQALLGDDPRPLLALAPGAMHANKRWPAARFGLVARGLPGLRPVLAGSVADGRELDELRAALGERAAVDARALDLPGLAVLLARATLVVSNDSGPVHLAQAVGTPVVAAYGPTDPTRWGPRGARTRAVSLHLACSPCSNHGAAECPLGHHACLRELPAADVLAAARDVLR